jgi:hypothetical protein
MLFVPLDANDWFLLPVAEDDAPQICEAVGRIYLQGALRWSCTTKRVALAYGYSLATLRRSPGTHRLSCHAGRQCGGVIWLRTGISVHITRIQPQRVTWGSCEG